MGSKAGALQYTGLKKPPCVKTLQLIRSICKLQRKWSVVNTVLGPYSQHLIFFLTYEQAQKARALHDMC
jgi:hypothetical protein